MTSANSVRRHTLLAEPAPEDRATGAVSAPVRLDLRALFDAHYASVWRLLRRLGVGVGDLDDA